MEEHCVKHVEGAFFVLEAVPLKRSSDVEMLKAQINALNLKPAMLFLDTFARCAVGIDAMHVGEWIDTVSSDSNPFMRTG